MTESTPQWLEAALSESARPLPVDESSSAVTRSKDADLSPSDVDATQLLAGVPSANDEEDAGRGRDDDVAERRRAGDGAEPAVVREVVTQKAISPFTPFRRLLSPRFYAVVAIGSAAIWIAGLVCGQPWLSTIALPFGIATISFTLGNTVGRLIAGAVRTGQTAVGMVRGGSR